MMAIDWQILPAIGGGTGSFSSEALDLSLLNGGDKAIGFRAFAYGETAKFSVNALVARDSNPSEVDLWTEAAATIVYWLSEPATFADTPDGQISQPYNATSNVRLEVEFDVPADQYIYMALIHDGPRPILQADALCYYRFYQTITTASPITLDPDFTSGLEPQYAAPGQAFAFDASRQMVTVTVDVPVGGAVLWLRGDDPHYVDPIGAPRFPYNHTWGLKTGGQQVTIPVLDTARIYLWVSTDQTVPGSEGTIAVSVSNFSTEVTCAGTPFVSDATPIPAQSSWQMAQLGTSGAGRLGYDATGWVEGCAPFGAAFDTQGYDRPFESTAPASANSNFSNQYATKLPYGGVILRKEFDFLPTDKVTMNLFSLAPAHLYINDKEIYYFTPLRFFEYLPYLSMTGDLSYFNLHSGKNVFTVYLSNELSWPRVNRNDYSVEALYFDLMLSTSASVSGCSKYFEPGKVEWVGVSQSADNWQALSCGIDPELYSGNASAIPAFYDIRQCIEVWPAPSDDSWTLRIKGQFGLLPFAVDEDISTVDPHAIYLLALFNAKMYYKQPDALEYKQELEQYLRDLTAQTHLTHRYIPGTSARRARIPPKIEGEP